MQHCTAKDECLFKCSANEIKMYQENYGDRQVELMEQQGEMARYVQQLINDDLEKQQPCGVRAEKIQIAYSVSAWMELLNFH